MTKPVGDLIIEHFGCNARILAGPGTGKTSRLTDHIEYLINTKGVTPSRILVITFTKAATAEIKAKIKAKVGNRMPQITNIHSFALKTLVSDNNTNNQFLNISLLDDWEEKHLLCPEMRKRHSKYNSEKRFKDRISSYEAGWNTLTPDWASWVNDRDPDFYRTLTIFKRAFNFMLRGELIKELRDRFANDLIGVRNLGIEHLLIDEFQDLNPCDIEVINSLGKAGAEIMIAGDDDQSIYKFRQASPKSLIDFPTTNKPCEKYELLECHRCPQSILDYAMALIEKSTVTWRKTKKYKSKACHLAEIRCLQFNNTENELEGIRLICANLIENKKIPSGEIAVLVPRKRLGEELKNHLENEGINCIALFDQTTPLDSELARKAYSVLRVAANPNDQIGKWTWLYCCKGIGSTTKHQLTELAFSEEGGVSNVMDEIENYSDRLSIDSYNRISQKLNKLEEYASVIRADENLFNIPNHISFFFPDDNLKNLSDYLDEVISGLEDNDCSLISIVRSLQTSNIFADFGDNKGPVRIMTLHGAKGLTVEAAIVMGVENEYIMTHIKDNSDLEQARRLFYVAVTRARQYLCITHTHKRQGTLARSGNKFCALRHPCKFLSEAGFKSEIGEDYVNSL